MGSYEQQNACRQQLEETQGSLRFVKYELSRKGQEEMVSAPQIDDIQVSNDAMRLTSSASVWLTSYT